MTTSIDNNQRVFWIKGLGIASRNFFCNMADIEKCVKELPENEPYNIYHFWNSKPERLSKKTLKSFMQANGLNDRWIK